MLETHYLPLNLAVLAKDIFCLRENVKLVEVQCFRLLYACRFISVWNCPTDSKAIYYIKTSKVIMFPWISWKRLRWLMTNLKERFQRNEATWTRSRSTRQDPRNQAAAALLPEQLITQKTQPQISSISVISCYLRLFYYQQAQGTIFNLYIARCIITLQTSSLHLWSFHQVTANLPQKVSLPSFVQYKNVTAVLAI